MQVRKVGLKARRGMVVSAALAVAIAGTVVATAPAAIATPARAAALTAAAAPAPAALPVLPAKAKPRAKKGLFEPYSMSNLSLNKSVKIVKGKNYLANANGRVEIVKAGTVSTYRASNGRVYRPAKGQKFLAFSVKVTTDWSANASGYWDSQKLSSYDLSRLKQDWTLSYQYGSKVRNIDLNTYATDSAVQGAYTFLISYPKKIKPRLRVSYDGVQQYLDIRTAKRVVNKQLSPGYAKDDGITDIGLKLPAKYGNSPTGYSVTSTWEGPVDYWNSFRVDSAFTATYLPGKGWAKAGYKWVSVTGNEWSCNYSVPNAYGTWCSSDYSPTRLMVGATSYKPVDVTFRGDKARVDEGQFLFQVPIAARAMQLGVVVDQSADIDGAPGQTARLTFPSVKFTLPANN